MKKKKKKRENQVIFEINKKKEAKATGSKRLIVECQMNRS